MSALPAAAAAAAEWRATAHQYWPPQDARIRSSLVVHPHLGGVFPTSALSGGFGCSFAAMAPLFSFWSSPVLCLGSCVCVPCRLVSGVRCMARQHRFAARTCLFGRDCRGVFVPPLTPQRGRFAQSHISLNQPDQPTRGKAEKQQTEVSQTQAYYLLELAFERSHGAWPAGRAHTRVEFQLSLRNLAS